jgi:hypothetical protein
MDAPEPRYRDREESRFYQARGLSPEQTWHALGDELGRVLGDAQRAFWRVSLHLDRSASAGGTERSSPTTFRMTVDASAATEPSSAW